MMYLQLRINWRAIPWYEYCYYSVTLTFEPAALVDNNTISTIDITVHRSTFIAYTISTFFRKWPVLPGRVRTASYLNREEVISTTS